MGGIDVSKRHRRTRTPVATRKRPARWTVAAVVATCCLALPADALAKTPPPASHNTIDKTRLILILALIVLAGLSWFLKDVLIGTDKRVSTSKTTAAVWTFLVAGSLLGFVVAKFFGFPQGLENMMHSGLAGQYGLLIGGPLGSAVLAKGIVGKQVSESSAAKTPGTTGANPAQLVQNDAGETDLGDFQYILFNLVAMVYFVGTVLQSPASGFPHIPDILLGLTSVSAAGYVAKKALPTKAPTASLATKSAPAKAVIKITGTGLLIAEEPQTTVLSVLFGSVGAEIQSQSRTEGTDTIEVVVPEALAQGAAVDVVVVTPAPARVSAGSFTRE